MKSVTLVLNGPFAALGRAVRPLLSYSPFDSVKIDELLPIFLEMKHAESIAIAAWFKGDDLPELPSVPGLTVGPARDDGELALVTGSFDRVLAAKRALGQKPYIARLGAESVGYAWVATGPAHIGEIGVSFQVMPEDRYLCELVIFDPRGADLEPQILQAIVRQEKPGRFWAAAGCHKGLSLAELQSAGFDMVASLRFSPGSGVTLTPGASGERLDAAAELLDLPVTAEPATRRRARTRTRQPAPARQARTLVA